MVYLVFKISNAPLHLKRMTFIRFSSKIFRKREDKSILFKEHSRRNHTKHGPWVGCSQPLARNSSRLHCPCNEHDGDGGSVRRNFLSPLGLLSLTRTCPLEAYDDHICRHTSTFHYHSQPPSEMMLSNLCRNSPHFAGPERQHLQLSLHTQHTNQGSQSKGWRQSLWSALA